MVSPDFLTRQLVEAVALGLAFLNRKGVLGIKKRRKMKKWNVGGLSKAWGRMGHLQRPPVAYALGSVATN